MEANLKEIATGSALSKAIKDCEDELQAAEKDLKQIHVKVTAHHDQQEFL